MRIGVYPGSFDPATLGHLDIIQRASRLFDKLIVAPMINGEKHSSFTMEEKVDFLQRMTHDLPNVEVESFSGLLADYVKEKNACAIVFNRKSLHAHPAGNQLIVLENRCHTV